MLKTAERRELSKRVQEALAERPEVRPFPAAVTQLLAACQDANTKPEKFEEIIQCDPALTVRLLRMANSPLYGLANEVRSITHAISILGMRQIKTLALSVAGGSMFAEGATSAQQREDLWNHSLGCAAVARVLAKSAPDVSPDDAFLAGIFHDVGKLLLYDVVADEYARVASDYRGEALIAEEIAVFGSSHPEIGLKSAHAWGLPEELKVVIAHHHQPERAPAHHKLATTLHVSDRLAHAWGMGSKVLPDVEVFAETTTQMALDDELLARLQEPAREVYEGARRALA